MLEYINEIRQRFGAEVDTAKIVDGATKYLLKATDSNLNKLTEYTHILSQSSTSLDKLKLEYTVKLLETLSVALKYTDINYFLANSDLGRIVNFVKKSNPSLRKYELFKRIIW